LNATSDIEIKAEASNTITSISHATAGSFAIGAAAGATTARVEASPTVEAYAGSGARLSTTSDIVITATSVNDGSSKTLAAGGGLIGIGTTISTAITSGSVSAHMDGTVAAARDLVI